MVVSADIFLTVSSGSPSRGDLKKAARVGLQGHRLFRVSPEVALGVGLCVANVIQTGAGPVGRRPSEMNDQLKEYQQEAKEKVRRRP